MANRQTKKRSARSAKYLAGKADLVATSPTEASDEGVAKCPPPLELDDSKPDLKHLGGSITDAWNLYLCNQVISSAKYRRADTAEEKGKQHFAHFAFLAGVNPQDVIEGMMAAQLFASHAASMECYRRAMLPDQPPEGRQMNLTQAAKLTRANAAQVEALARHRNKGQQKITIEHVHVYQGGQAAFISGAAPGEGVANFKEVQPHAIGHAAGAPMRGQDTQGHLLPVGSDAKWAMPDARRAVPRRA